MSARAWKTIARMIACGSCVAAAACSSIKSTIYDNDNYSGVGRQEKKLHGIPVTLDVPTHVKITVLETQYFDTVNGSTNVTRAIEPTRKVDYELVAWKELYTVDFKRPAAGINDLKLQFAEKTSGGQYFQSIQQDVTDVTIDKVAGLIQQIIASTPTLRSLADARSTSKDPTPPASGLHEITRVAAMEFFDIRQPNLEGRIQEFLNRYINNCSPVCPAPCPVRINATEPLAHPQGS